MNRVQADLVLLIVALIWGAAFVAQKEAFDHVGTYTFIASRFFLSMLLVAPLAWREHKRNEPVTRSHGMEIGLLALVFTAAVVLQQEGIKHTSVTNAGFLTGLYVLFVPIVCLLVYKQKLSSFIYPAALLSVIGVYCLSRNSGEMTALGLGDILVLLCAVGFGFQVAMVGRIVNKVKAPIRICFWQYAACFTLCLIAAVIFENPTWEGIRAAGIPILYAGAISGGIAYTLQVIAQQYTPASDSAVILSAESLFAALFGALMMSERLSPLGAAGCGLIIIAILTVEFGPFLARKKA